MTLNDKVQVGDTTAGTSTSTTTTTSQWQTYNNYRAEQGWECARCGRINAPWVRQCDCSRSNWYTTWTSDKSTTGDKPEWWKDYVTCMQTNDVTNNPNIYQVGGSDYRAGDTYVNVNGTQSNKVEPNVTAWSGTNPNTVVKATGATTTVQEEDKGHRIFNKYLREKK